MQFHYLHCLPFLRCSTITYTARLFYAAVLLLTLPAFFYGAVLLLTLPAYFTVQYYCLHCPPFLRWSTITYTARLFFGAVLVLTLPAFFTVQYYYLYCLSFLRWSTTNYTECFNLFYGLLLGLLFDGRSVYGHVITRIFFRASFKRRATLRGLSNTVGQNPVLSLCFPSENRKSSGVKS